MPEELKELTESQKKLLDLLFRPENREIAISSNWDPLLEAAGYASGASKASVMYSKLFKDTFEDGIADYMTALQMQAVLVTEDVLAGKNPKPSDATRLSAARDVFDRSKKLVKRSESTVVADVNSPVIILPGKDQIDETD